jgi:hypothetical protein
MLRQICNPVKNRVCLSGFVILSVQNIDLGIKFKEQVYVHLIFMSILR